MKEHKTQILAALALALALGMAVPTAAFASEGGEDPASGDVVTLSEDGGIMLVAAAPQSSAQNLFVLVNQIRSDSAFSKYQTLYAAQTKLAAEIEAHAADDTAVADADIDAVRNAVLAILPSAKVSNTNARELNAFVLAMDGYKDWTNAIDTLSNIARKTDTSIAGITEALISSKMSQTDIKSSYDTLNKFINRVTGTLAENVAKLYARVSFGAGFAGYRNAQPLVIAAKAAEPYNAGAKAFFQNSAPVKDNKTFWDNLSPAAQNAVTNKSVEEALTYLKQRTDTANVIDLINQMDNSLKSVKTTLLNAVKSASPTANVNEDSTVAELIAAAEGVSGFVNFTSLYNNTDFIRIATNNATATTTCGSDTTNCLGLVAQINSKYPDQGTLMKYYVAMLNSAAKIDNNVSVGLMTSTLPNTSTGGDDNKPGSNDPGEKDPGLNAPGTGIIGLFESGALDLGTLTLIVSVGLTGIAGLTLIAKLYLKHKF